MQQPPRPSQASGPSVNGAGEISLTCCDEAATCRLAEDLAMVLAPGDCLCLVGDLGAGKSTLARALLRALADDDALEVPSPTFTLVQGYALRRFPVAHLDLYRLEDPQEADELGLDDMLETGAALVEWPERAPDHIPASRLVVRIAPAGEGDDARQVQLSWESGTWGRRIVRTLAIRALLAKAGFGLARRRYFQGDASPRRYEAITQEGRSAILMNADPAARPSSPPLRDGLSYAEIVHLPDTIDAVAAVCEALRARGLAAPALLAADLDAGLVLQEDLGRDGVLVDGRPDPQRYAAAMDVLADLHAAPPQEVLPLPAGIGGGESYRLPHFDMDAFLTEADLYPDWYLPAAGVEVTQALRAEFHALWRPLLAAAQARPQTWVLRDYHSPNLIWRGDRQGTDRIGIVDTQDTVIGPDAYDVASLAMDARVTVPRDLEAALVARYVARRQACDAGFDAAGFRRDYAVMAAQRATKILGVFVRLDRRDGKPQYLAHLPRVRDYLARALDDPALAPLRRWFAGVDEEMAALLAPGRN
jgi:tRNA threonylcarbamoyl adenosine modification protein YjeE